MNLSSIVSFFRVSLGPWCFLLRLATLHPSQLARVRIFLRSHGLSIFNEGYDFAVHVSSIMAGWMLSRHHSLFLESLPAGCTRGYASCVHRESSISRQHALPRAAVLLNTHFHILRADCWCFSAAHTPSARCACKALSPLVVVLQEGFMSLVFTNTAPAQHPSSCSSHVRSSSTM